MIRVIVAVCHSTLSTRETWSVMGVSLFAPWIAVDVIAAQLPEAGFVLLSEL
jgi:hypothetical protein